MGEGETKANNNATKSKYVDDDKWTDYIWNNKTKQFFGRTGSSWVKIFVFYVVFYAALAAFAWGCYYMFDKWTLTKEKPRWILDSSIIGTNPGVGFRPMPDQETNSGSSLIWYKRGNEQDAAMWYQQLANYTDKVENPIPSESGDSMQQCTYDNGNKASDTKICRVDMKEYGSHCTKQNKFGYTIGEPCMLIKLNRIFGWKPEPLGIDKEGKYNETLLKKDLDDKMEKNMPESLRTYIEEGVAKASNPASYLNTVWISCQGENVADQENLGPLGYYPQQGIPGFYFPFMKQPGYQSPFIFVHLIKPKYNTLINIECRAWAKNSVYDKQDRLGSVHFEILID